MDWFVKINRYYTMGKYTVDQVKIFVQTGKITEIEFKSITEQDYIL